MADIASQPTPAQSLNDSIDSLCRTALQVKTERDELLDFLRQVISYADPNERVRSYDGAALDRLCRDAKAIIAKAEGRI